MHVNNEFRDSYEIDIILTGESANSPEFSVSLRIFRPKRMKDYVQGRHEDLTIFYDVRCIYVLFMCAGIYLTTSTIACTLRLFLSPSQQSRYLFQFKIHSTMFCYWCCSFHITFLRTPYELSKATPHSCQGMQQDQAHISTSKTHKWCCERSLQHAFSKLIGSHLVCASST